MSIRGWVYVLASKGSPDLVKVGFSTKDPVLRAAELNSTGVPYPFDVEYDVLVERPRDIEQAAHQLLSGVHFNKEFFRTDVLTAAQAIRLAIGNRGQRPLFETEGEKLKMLSLATEIEADGEKPKTPSGCAVIALQPFHSGTPIPASNNKSERRSFLGKNYSVACRQCGYVYSIAQVHSDEKGEAGCPTCRTKNWTPI